MWRQYDFHLIAPALPLCQDNFRALHKNNVCRKRAVAILLPLAVIVVSLATSSVRFQWHIYLEDELDFLLHNFAKIFAKPFTSAKTCVISISGGNGLCIRQNRAGFSTSKSEINLVARLAFFENRDAVFWISFVKVLSCGEVRLKNRSCYFEKARHLIVPWDENTFSLNRSSD